MNITGGSLLRFNGTQISLSNIKNVSVGSPAMNQVLAFNGTNWTNAKTGESFEVQMNDPAASDMEISWWIMEAKQ